MKRHLLWLPLLLVALSLVETSLISAQGRGYLFSQGASTCPMVHMVVLIDHSGSMNRRCGANLQNDPYDMRLWVTEEALTFLAQSVSSWDDTAEVQVDVLLFGSRVEPLTSFRLSSQTDPKDIEQKLQVLDPQQGHIPETLCNTNFVDPLQAAVDRLATVFPMRGTDCPSRLVLLVTDGKPYLDPEEDPAGRFYENGNFIVSAHMRDVRQYWEEYGQDAQFDLIVLDPQQRIWPQMQSLWQPIVDQVYVVQRPSDMASDIFEVLQQVLAQIPLRQQVRVVPVCGRAEVPPYSQEVTFLYWKDDPSHYITVTDPDGNLVIDHGKVLSQAHQVNYTTVSPVIDKVTIPNPMPGEWQVRGQGRCRIHMVLSALQVNVTRPQHLPLTAFQPAEIELQVSGQGGGVPVAGMNQPPLQISAYVQDPQGQQNPLPLQEAADLLYRGEFTPEKEGEHALFFWGEVNGSTVLGSQQQPIKILQVQLPKVQWLDKPLLYGQYSQYTDMTWRFRLLDAHGNPMMLASGFALDAGLQVQLPDGTRQGLPVTWNEDQQLWEATMPLPQEGEYTWQYSLRVNTPSGAQVLLEEGDQSVFQTFAAEPLEVVFSSERFFATDIIGRKQPYVEIPFQVKGRATNQMVDLSQVIKGAFPLEAELYGRNQQRLASTEDGTLQILTTPHGYEVQVPVEHIFGAYTLRIKPKDDVPLPSGYVWYQPPWDQVIQMTVHPGAVGLGGAVLLGLILLLLCVVMWLSTRRQTVTLEVYRQGEGEDGFSLATWHVAYKAKYHRGWGLPFFWPRLPCLWPQRVQRLDLDGLRRVLVRQDAKGRIQIRYTTTKGKTKKVTLPAGGGIVNLVTPADNYRVERRSNSYL